MINAEGIAAEHVPGTRIAAAPLTKVLPTLRLLAAYFTHVFLLLSALF